jgi:hypothetical protein
MDEAAQDQPLLDPTNYGFRKDDSVTDTTEACATTHRCMGQMEC